MPLKFTLLLTVLTFYSFLAFSQNTNQNNNAMPDTNKINPALTVPGAGGGSSPVSSPKPTESKNKSLEFEIMEESPNKGEPVPGAEILIEQGSFETPQNSHENNSENKTEKDKKKEKDKKPKK